MKGFYGQSSLSALSAVLILPAVIVAMLVFILVVIKIFRNLEIIKRTLKENKQFFNEYSDKIEKSQIELENLRRELKLKAGTLANSGGENEKNT